jgi:hypothetical protein
MKRQDRILHRWAAFLLAGSMLAACGGAPAATGEPSQEPMIGPGAGLPNPASAYCTGLGYELEMRTNENGEYGVCVFPDGTECDEWDFMAGRCGQDHSYCSQQGYTLRDEATNMAVCVFPDGSSCPEYDFYSGACGPAASPQ